MTILTMHPPLQLQLLRQDSESSFSRYEPTKSKLDADYLEEEEQQFVEVSLVHNDDDDNTSTTTTSICITSSKKVRFKNTATVHDYLHVGDITKKEKAAAWITSVAPTKAEMLRTKILVVEGRFRGDNLELTQRGLELRQRNLMVVCRAAVVQAQGESPYFGTTRSPEERAQLIASRYLVLSNNAAEIAATRGKKDEEEVTNMYLPERLAREAMEGFGFYDDDNDQSDSSDDEIFQNDEWQSNSK